jgi:shikimate kinase
MNLPQTNVSDNAPIFLVGFMGAGKTTVGRALANNLEYNFFDLDELICAGVGKSVPEIFSELGEAEFRKLESEAIQSCRGLGRTVIALGGGAYVSEGNRTVLREIGKTVWLDCPLEICLSRIAGDQSRPLLGDQDEMRALLAQRRSAYARADFTVQAAERSQDELAIEITKLLRP